MPNFAHDGLCFHYVESGDGLPVVFQHGLGCDLSQIVNLFQPPPTFRLITMDARAHGQTQPLGPVEKLGFNTFAEDLVALLDHLGINQAVVGGSSMGAAMALNMALRFPQRVQALILYRPCWIDQPLPANASGYPRIAQCLQQYGAKEGSEQFRQSDEFQEIFRQSPYVANSQLSLFYDPRAEETAIKFDRIARDAPCKNLAELGAIRVPVLVLANRQDPVHPFEYGTILTQAIAGAKFCEVASKSEGEDRHAADVRAAITEFLRSSFS